MVSIGTYLGVSDNSGATEVKCIKILGSSFCNHTNIGDKLIVSVQAAGYNKAVAKHEVHSSLLIRQRNKTLRKTGVFYACMHNSVVIVKKNNEPIGNRVNGSVLQELRYKKCVKIMSLADNII
jgi:large subunit ribosomal protein L14